MVLPTQSNKGCRHALWRCWARSLTPTSLSVPRVKGSSGHGVGGECQAGLGARVRGVRGREPVPGRDGGTRRQDGKGAEIPSPQLMLHCPITFHLQNTDSKSK